jgi:hypothetical protein
MTQVLRHRPRALHSWVALLALLSAGCEGILGNDNPDEEGERPGNSEKPGDDENPVKIDDLDVVDPETLPDGVAPASRFVRLGYSEYDRTVADLLHLEGNWSAVFPAEPPTLGSYDGIANRAVIERLFNEFRAVAIETAEEVVTTPDVYAKVVGCSDSTPACRDSFIEGFGTRAYRRPLTDSERARWVTLFDSAGDLVASGDAFRDGVQMVIESALQSPNFLYRIEQGTGVPDETGVPLTGYEIASRLSYLFVGTMPDDELLEAAQSGALETRDGIASQARRLAESPAASARVRDFHARWIQLGELDTVGKSTEAFPKFSQELLDSMREETLSFVESVTLEENGAVVELLTAPHTMVNAQLADLYQLPGSFGETFQRADLPTESGRLGLLTQGAFLTGHSSNSTSTSPILRGVFLLKRLACQEIPAPPPGAELQEPDGPRPDIRTTRELFTWKTSQNGCSQCHSVINPVGFAFEQFDGIGQFRTTENGVAVDSTGVLELGPDTIEFNTAAELIRGLADLGRVRGCYAQNWLTYFYGRQEAATDGRVMARMTQGMKAGDYGVRDILVTITEGAAFTHLPPISE